MRLPHPDHYHGRGKKPPFFEGWYYRFTSADGSRRLAVIPGVYNHPNPVENRSFFVIFDASGGKGYFVPHPHDAFVCSQGMNVSLAGSRFDRDEVSLNIQGDGLSLSGELTFSSALRWPRGPFSPGVMGPFTHLPVMECYYQVTNMAGDLSGSVNLNGEVLDFTGGRGYIEKNWGSSFPRAWVWLQTNHFENDPHAAFMLSTAHIPFPLGDFTGITGGLYAEGTFHTFATFKGIKLRKLSLDSSGGIEMVLKQKDWLLEIEAQHMDAVPLCAPTIDGMTGRVAESLNSNLILRATKAGRVVFEGKSSLTGMELSPKVEELIT